jgi:single-stranded-DNA-specific exonuclease
MLPIQHRPTPNANDLALLADAGLHHRVTQALIQRGVTSTEEALLRIKLLPYQGLKGIGAMAVGIAHAILAGERMVVVADYDCDGATACTVAVSGLMAVGADIDFVVPNRFIHGYGLTPSVVELAAKKDPKWIITVDNGIASIEGVAAANERGIGVWVTDHHLPGDSLPSAAEIVNPNQPGCSFPSKNLAGCGVMFYVLAAVKDALKALDPAGPYGARARAMNIMDWIDIVALGTVADVVRLDANNRWLVQQGLIRIRQGRMRPGLMALFQVARKDPAWASAQDFGFGLGPRLNAAGRLEDMSIGIRCLLANTFDEALPLAKELDELNQLRKKIEGDVREISEGLVDAERQHGRFTRVVFGATFHEGVIGIVAGRIKEQSYAPTIVFGRENGGVGPNWKGSARSIPGCHLRDVLDLVYKKHPTWFVKFGGHAMAAGLTITDEAMHNGFADAFEAAVAQWFENKRPEQILVVDGVLEPEDISLETANAVLDNVWGQGFEEPTWIGSFQVRQAELKGEKSNHLKLIVAAIGSDGHIPVWDPNGWNDDDDTTTFTAMHFFQNEEAEIPEPGSVITLAYKLGRNVFRGNSELTLMIVDRSSQHEAVSMEAIG